MADWRSELAGCRSTLSMSKIKVKISETKFLSFYKTLVTAVNCTCALLEKIMLIFVSAYFTETHGSRQPVGTSVILVISLNSSNHSSVSFSGGNFLHQVS